jgi:F-type H+-transporting ATPase subunit delta
MTGKQIELKLTVDPEIIGGLIARIGDVLVDGSVISQLRRLRARLASTA